MYVLLGDAPGWGTTCLELQPFKMGGLLDVNFPGISEATHESPLPCATECMHIEVAFGKLAMAISAKSWRGVASAPTASWLSCPDGRWSPGERVPPRTRRRVPEVRAGSWTNGSSRCLTGRRVFSCPMSGFKGCCLYQGDFGGVGQKL